MRDSTKFDKSKAVLIERVSSGEILILNFVSVDVINSKCAKESQFK